MSQPAEPKADFKFVLNSVRSESVQAVAQELTQLFPLDLPNALTITRNAPIILIDKLTAQQGRHVGSFAIRLKRLGADVQVTSQPVGKLQVLRWPLLPEIARRSASQLVCPSCGATLRVLTAEVAEAAPAAQPSAPAVAPPAPAAPAAAPRPAPPAAPVQEPAEEVVLEPIAEEEPAADLSDEEVVLEETPSQPASAPGPPVGGGGSCRVMLVGKLKGDKKRRAAELMAYYQGITPEEALLQLGKTVVTVGKDLTPEQADTCKGEFANIGVKVSVKG